MKPFAYARPERAMDAVKLLAAQWDQTAVLAGGTDLVTAMKQRIAAPETVVSLGRIADLRGIVREAEYVRIGACATLQDVVDDVTIRETCRAVHSAVNHIGSPQVRARATVGGDLCQRPRCWYFRDGFGLLAQRDGKSMVKEGDNRYHAVFGNDGPAAFVCPSSLGAALSAMNATLFLLAADGQTRELSVQELYRIPRADHERELTLGPNELIIEVRVPMEGRRSGAYEARQRKGLDWPLASAFVSYKVDGGTINSARVVLGHVAPTPWLSAPASQALDGKRLDEALAAAAGEAAVTEATPLSKNGYKVQLAKVCVKRALLDALHGTEV